MASLNQEQLLRLARLGAIARLEQLKQEEAAIRREFPDLFRRGRKSASGKAAAAGTSRGRKRAMSAANRKAVSERMRKYWAERRKARTGK